MAVSSARGGTFLEIHVQYCIVLFCNAIVPIPETVHKLMIKSKADLITTNLNKKAIKQEIVLCFMINTVTDKNPPIFW